MSYLPLAINIEGKKILIIGGGKVALKKAKILSQYTENITFLAKEFDKELLDNFNSYYFIQKPYKAKYLKGFSIVYICTDNPKLNEKISKDAKRRKILVNVCDNPSLSDFISPAIYKRGFMSIAVTSDATDVNKSIALRNRIREFLEDVGF
ncbi:MAG: precorrin-2 dehydrogenase/sirohydrochlorin ferrochelatase family protein [Brevinematia bacterium]